MNPETYHRDHWASIEAERLERYEAMFEWHPRMAPLLEPARLEAGLRVLDFGCGPGGLSMEMARTVGDRGRVDGLDLNAEMIKLADARAARERLTHIARFAQHSEARLPWPDSTFDRAVSKSVLEYVDDPGATLAELKRVTCPGGYVHVVDSDWGLLVLEPLDDDELAGLKVAAAAAWRTPHIGRRLPGLFRAAGLEEVTVRILAAADTTGVRFSVAEHLLGYAEEAGTLDGATIAAHRARLKQALAAGEYLMVLPQFVVTGRVP